MPMPALMCSYTGQFTCISLTQMQTSKGLLAELLQVPAEQIFMSRRFSIELVLLETSRVPVLPPEH